MFGNVVAAMGLGIRISGSANDISTDNRIESNFVGTDIDGTVDLGNCCGGILLEGAVTNTVVGGSTPASRNVVSGNGNQGLQLSNSALAIGNVAEGNFIGTDVTGTLDLGNDGTGIQVGAGNGHLIVDNVVSGNPEKAQGMSTWRRSKFGTHEGNLIGTNAQGTAAIPNHGAGIKKNSG